MIKMTETVWAMNLDLRARGSLVWRRCGVSVREVLQRVPYHREAMRLHFPRNRRQKYCRWLAWSNNFIHGQCHGTHNTRPFSPVMGYNPKNCSWRNNIGDRVHFKLIVTPRGQSMSPKCEDQYLSFTLSFSYDIENKLETKEYGWLRLKACRYWWWFAKEPTNLPYMKNLRDGYIN